MKRLPFIAAALALTVFACSPKEQPKEEVQEPEQVNVSELLDVKPNEHLINPASDTMIAGAQGTLIYIPKNALVLANGEAPEGEVKIVLKEYYDKSQILTQPLTTMTEDGKLLKSAGMIDLQAYSNGRALELKDRKEIMVHFPKNNKNEDMGLFSGVRDENNQVVWKKEKTQEAKYKDKIVHWYTKLDSLDESKLYTADGKEIYDWIRKDFKLTPSEQEYFAYKDIYLNYTVTKEGKIVNPVFEKKIRSKIKKRLLKVMEGAPDCKPYTVLGKPVENECSFQLAVEVIPPKYASDKSYLGAIKSKAIQNEGKSINSLSKMELHYYIFNSNKLGLINCDEFINDPDPKCTFAINVDNATDDMVKLAFKDYNSYLAGDFKDGKYHFTNVPQGKDATIMVLKYTNGKAQVGFQDIKTSNQEISPIPMTEMTLAQLQEELDKLN